MDASDQLILTGVMGFCAALIAALIAQAYLLWQSRPLQSPRPASIQEIARSYVFREGYLVSDIVFPDWYLPQDCDRSAAWRLLGTGLSRLHQDAAQAMEDLARMGQGFFLLAKLGADDLSISGMRENDQITITIAPVMAHGKTCLIDTASLDTLRFDVGWMRQMLDSAPVPIWRYDSTGKIAWANSAYFALLAQLAPRGDGGLFWPLPDVFADYLDQARLAEGGKFRCAIAGDGAPDQMHWFELSCHSPVAVDDAARQAMGLICFATPCNDLVATEQSLSNFVQTLSKTFAHLPTGLAVFDQKRELILFNPALVLLSKLDAQWLAGRPSLSDFLDQLREHRRIPEQRDYRAFRSGLADLEPSSEAGFYQEIWTLPEGQTYRVSGRPQPDGALAFLFEDITHEVALTRKFRSDLDLFQSVIDRGGDALAVFSNEGELELSSAAYAILWGKNPAEYLATTSVDEAAALWAARSRASDFWPKLVDFVKAPQDRQILQETIWLSNGARVDVQVSALRGGRSLIRFIRETGLSLSDLTGNAARDAALFAEGR